MTARIVVYPADESGCGKIRLEWPVEALRRLGCHEVESVRQENRHLQLVMTSDGHVQRVIVPEGAEVVVLQRTTHSYVVEAISLLRSQGIAVVVDVDDDLAAIDPNNPAWQILHPDHVKAGRSQHSWLNLTEACRRATLVTVSTPGLLARYAKHGRGHVLPNYLPNVYYQQERIDTPIIGWAAALHSHPNDPAVVGNALARLTGEGASFLMVGPPQGIGRAFGLHADPPGHGVPIEEYPAAIARFGIGIAPLADTLFNSRKSWLKPLEYSAVGVPWVASPRAEYLRLHKMGAGLVAAKPKDWYRQLGRLWRSASLRADLSDAGRQIAAQLAVDTHAWEYLEAWQRALEIQRSSAPTAVGT